MTDKWQDIATAPKGGVDVLLYFPEAEKYDHCDPVLIGHYHKIREIWVWQNRAVRGYSFPPTHWMPLPTPPETQP